MIFNFLIEYCFPLYKENYYNQNKYIITVILSTYRIVKTCWINFLLIYIFILKVIKYVLTLMNSNYNVTF